MTDSISPKYRVITWLCIVVVTPLGLVLLWTRKDFRLRTKLFGSLAAIAFMFLNLNLFWGMKVDFDGGLTRPIITFQSDERHHREIDRLHESERSIDASQMQATSGADTAERRDPSEGKRSDAQPLLKPRAYWSEYRGPGRRGIYDETEIRIDWPSDGLPLLWKRPVGGGYASVVVAEGVVFTIEQRRKREVVAAYDLRTGREKWIHGWDAEFTETLGGDGPRATPVWDDGRIYALGAEGELSCLDADTGAKYWSRNILLENGAANLQWGMAASPLIVDDKVIVLPGGSGGKSVVAYNKSTGAPVWSVLDDRQAYTAPQLVTVADRRQILVVSAQRVMGLVPEDGSLLWEHPWVTHSGINATQPIITGKNSLYISAGYDHGAASVEITGRDKTFSVRTLWQNNRMKNKFGSAVLHDGHIYGLDESILACIDAATGERKWKGGRYGYGQVLLASGHLIISTETGDVVLVKAIPEKYEEVSRFSALKGKTWNVPAMAEGLLIVRNTTEMACYNVSK